MRAERSSLLLYDRDTDQLYSKIAEGMQTRERGPAKVLIALADLAVEQATDAVAARQARDTALNYLTKRLDQIQVSSLPGSGVPIGSGSVESANKLVVEARLKAVACTGRAHMSIRWSLCGRSPAPLAGPRHGRGSSTTSAIKRVTDDYSGNVPVVQRGPRAVQPRRRPYQIVR
jgi:hypothetical protein